MATSTHQIYIIRRCVISSSRLIRRGYRYLSSSGHEFPPSTSILFLAGLFPEPTASAAGVRTQFLVQQLARAEGVQGIHFGTGVSKPKTDSTAALKDLGVEFHHVPPNDSHCIQRLIQKLCGADQGKNLVVVLDRFYGEEAYSFHVRQHAPNAAIVLDMQDLHSLRRFRQEIVEKNRNHQEDPLSNLPTDFPKAQDTNLQRELASIHRSDLTLVCSPVELDHLQHRYGIPPNKLCLATFFVDQISRSTTPTFSQRSDFVFVGGFRHDPNVDALKQMKRLWPEIRKRIVGDDVAFHVYGPFCPSNLQLACHDPSQGFYMHGHCSRPVQELLSNRRVLLAPLRFGAGIKGKIVDAWTCGTPVVTTCLGAEGMQSASSTTNQWGGAIAQNSREFIQAAVDLYQNEQQWDSAKTKGRELVTELYDVAHWDSVLKTLVEVRENLEARREADFTRAVLWQQSTRSTEYFSRWIELKEKQKT
jgi:O-antigen biosynthesis protein